MENTYTEGEVTLNRKESLIIKIHALIDGQWRAIRAVLLACSVTVKLKNMLGQLSLTASVAMMCSGSTLLHLKEDMRVYTQCSSIMLRDEREP